MLQITEKQIDLARSEVLYNRPFTNASLQNDWEITGGQWSVENGWLTGFYAENAGGLVYTRQSFPGDILLDFMGRTIVPCNNDLNFSFCTEGWNSEANDAGRGYIAGIGGWWEGKTGIEHYPQRSPWAGTPLFELKAGQAYHIQAGTLAGHCFIFIDGRLIIEMLDPTYSLLSSFGRVGLGTYCSHVQFGELKLLRPMWKRIEMSYIPNL